MFLHLGDGHGLEPETHMLGNPHSSCRGSCYVRPLGRPVIEAFVGGACAEQLERNGLVGAFAFASDELATLLGERHPRQAAPPCRVGMARERTPSADRTAMLPGRAASRAVLARPIDGRLFFGGEATDAADYSTAHRAWQSGERAAAQALAALGEHRAA